MSAKNRFKKVVSLVNEYEENALSFPGRADNNRNILKSFFNDPVLTIKQMEMQTGLSQPTVERVVKNMIDSEMLHEVTGYSRNRVFRLTKYLELFSTSDMLD